MGWETSTVGISRAPHATASSPAIAIGPILVHSRAVPPFDCVETRGFRPLSPVHRLRGVADI